MDVQNSDINIKNEKKKLINNNEEITFDRGNFNEKDHRLFLESFILFDKNFKEMVQYAENKTYNDILLYSDKFISFLNKKYNQKECGENLIINKDNLNNFTNEELEKYINDKFCISSNKSYKENSNSVDNFFIDDNKSLLGLSNNNKKIFFIRKYPKYRTLLNNNLNDENKNNFSDINVPNIGNDKESRKKLINKLLNENCKESNYTKMEELAKMSEILQIINKVENYNVTNDESLVSKTKSLGTYDSNSNLNNSNQINNLNNSNLGKKRLQYNSLIENEKKDKIFENINDINQINQSNLNSNFQKDFILNNNTNIPFKNNYMKNIFLSSPENNILNQQTNLINNQNLNINNPYLFNPINPMNYYPNINNQNTVSNYNNLMTQQFLPPPVLNLPFPMIGIPNINQSMIYQQNNQNPFFNNMNVLMNPQQNLNLINAMNYLYPQNQQNIFNSQNREIYNNNLQNYSNINYNQSNINIQKNQSNFNNK